MDDTTPPTHQPALVKQADSLITAETTWPDLAEGLDVSQYRHRDGYDHWHASTPFEPMFLSHLWATVEEIPVSAIPTELNKTPALARAIGFNLDELPDESTFRRAKTHRFTGLNRTIESAADEIQRIAAERGAPIGYPLTPPTTTQDTDQKPTKRTINRALRTRGNDALEEIRSTVFPSINLPRPENPVYDTDDLLELETVAGLGRLAANGAGEALGDKKNPRPDLTDPFYEDGPTGETLLESIKEMSIDDITRKLNFALRKSYTRAKPRLQDLDEYDTNALVAIDITYVGYYGERDDLVWVQGTPRKNHDHKPYDWCFMFATATIVGQNTHYVAATLPIGNPAYASNDRYAGSTDQTYHTGDVVDRLLSIASQHVNIRTVFADREFCAADVINTLEKRNLQYVIPSPKTKRIRRKCKRFEQISRGYDERRDERLVVENEYAIYGPVKDHAQNTRVTTNLVILAPDEDDKIHRDCSPRPFVTNASVDDEIALDRRLARQKIERYSKRAAIEKSYTSIRECAAWTTSKAFEVRWFHFGFACILYNFWLLVDFLTQCRLSLVEAQRSPRISLKRFLGWLERAVVADL